MTYEVPQERAELEVSYCEPHVEKEIADWAGKTIKSARVVHTGSDGLLTVEFTDGRTKEYCFNELAFWGPSKPYPEGMRPRGDNAVW